MTVPTTIVGFAAAAMERLASVAISSSVSSAQTRDVDSEKVHHQQQHYHTNAPQRPTTPDVSRHLVALAIICAAIIATFSYDAWETRAEKRARECFFKDE